MIKKENIITMKTGLWYGVDAFKQDLLQNPNIVAATSLFHSPDAFLWTNKDVKWNGEPIIPELLEFVDQKFDLLFVLTDADHISVQYISKLSQASCKVGSLSENNEHLDLMIDQSKNKTLENLIEESLNYLTLIKK